MVKGWQIAAGVVGTITALGLGIRAAWGAIPNTVPQARIRAVDQNGNAIQQSQLATLTISGGGTYTMPFIITGQNAGDQVTITVNGGSAGTQTSVFARWQDNNSTNPTRVIALNLPDSGGQIVTFTAVFTVTTPTGTTASITPSSVAFQSGSTITVNLAGYQANETVRLSLEGTALQGYQAVQMNAQGAAAVNISLTVVTTGTYTLLGVGNTSARQADVDLQITVNTPPPNGTFSANTLLSGLNENGASVPTKMIFIPDTGAFDTPGSGDIIVNIKTGASYYLRRDPTTGAYTKQTPNFATVPGVYAGGDEQGLIGVAFPPDYITSKFVYFYHTNNTPRENRVVRYRVNPPDSNGNITVDPNSYTVVMGGIGTSGNHNSGGLRFDQNGNLYVSVGDNQNGNNSQDLTVLMGKILRIHPENAPVNGFLYTIPADNPFAQSTGNQRKEIWCWGLRNPFSFDRHIHTGALFVNDVGLSTWEEVNDATTGGHNFGWQIIEGPLSASNNTGKTPPANYQDPVYAYPHVPNAPGTAGGFNAITGAAWYHFHGLKYPAAFEGSYWFGDYAAGFIKCLLSTNQHQAFDVLSGMAYPNGPVDMQPYAGEIHFITLDGRLRKVVYAP